MRDLQAERKINIDTIAVTNSTMGKVHQTIFIAFSLNVNKYAMGKTSKQSLKNEIKSGLKEYLNACKTPCMATLIPIKI
jgi:hypothetical protein